jgi:D-lactate dehydrogenase
MGLDGVRLRSGPGSPAPVPSPASPLASPLADQLAQALGASGCEVTGRPLDVLAMAHDASHYLVHPQVVARPHSTDEVADVMRACARLGVPLTFRGGGTSLSGQALSDSVLVDTRTAFSGVEVLDGGGRVRVQPGVTVRTVNAHLAPYRRRLGPDPASEGACTLGGVIANNSSGMQCGTELNTYRTLESMVLVFPSGTVLDSARPDAAAYFASAEPELHAGLLRLRDRIRDDTDSVATLRRLFSIKNTMGYGLNSFLDHDDPLEILVRLMVGSEGTLGFVASAVFRTVEVPPHIATGLLVFEDLQQASEAVPHVSAVGVSTAELLDAASLTVAQIDPACPEQIRRLQVDQQAALLVELQAQSADELQELSAAADRQLAQLRLASAAEMSSDPKERASLWRIRKGLYSAVAGARPQGSNALLEDVAVHTEQLGELCTGLTGLFDAHGYQGSVIFGHARDGNLHFMLNEQFTDEAKLRRYQDFTEDMVDLVLGLGGTLKAEHGTGRIMAPFVERQYGPALTDAMRELKALVDPGGLLNPGSVLTDDDGIWLRDLKTAPRVEEEVDRCVECGFCEPVCPSRTLTTTPRQRIVLRREMAAAEARGDIALKEELQRDYEYDGVQTCAVDGMCAVACPVLINTGDLTRRLRAASASTLSERVWTMAADHWDVAARGGAAALTVADRVPPGLPVGVTRAVRTVASHEAVPQYDSRLPAGGPRRPVLNEPDAAAVLFAACIGSMFGSPPGPGAGSRPDAGAAAALVRLCRRAGVPLRTPPDLESLCCGTPWKSKGHHDGHARMRDRVTASLEEATDGGRLPVVIDASSCAEGLTVMVADAGYTVLDALTFVADQVADRLTVARRTTRVVVHPTCSTTELGSTEALLRLAGMVADDVVVPVAWGCCGFAGDRGLLHPELTAAATAGEAEEVRGVPVAGTVYVSSNRTCEIGMTRATGLPYRHVLELLDEATA